MTTNFDHGQAQAQRSAAEKLRFIISNLQHLRKVDNKGKTEKSMKDFARIVAAGQRLTPNQMSYVDSAYEMVMRGAGFESVELHSDRKKGHKPRFR